MRKLPRMLVIFIIIGSILTIRDGEAIFGLIGLIGGGSVLGALTVRDRFKYLLKGGEVR